MKNHTLWHYFTRIEILLLTPALLLVTLGILHSGLGIKLMDSLPVLLQGIVFHPILILGGLLIVFFHNTYEILKFRWNSAGKSFVCEISFQGKGYQVGLALTSGLLLGLIVSYVFVENFQIIAH